MSVFLSVLDSATRGLILFAVASALGWLLHKRRAAARHLVWTAAITGQLVLPLFAYVPAAWRVTVPVPSVGILSTAAPGHPESRSESGDDRSLVQRAPFSSELGAAQTMDKRKSISVLDMLVGLWLIGLVFGTARVGMGTLRLRRCARSAQHLNDGTWLLLIQQVVRALGISRPVTVVRGSRFGVPVTWGTVYPVVFLPADALQWSDDRRRFILEHELAHVKRFDALTQIIAQITATIFWFSPLVWLAVRRMRLERELACDEAVIEAGAVPSRYAGELLDIARTQRGKVPTAFGALAAVHSSEFEHRMRSILRSGPLPLSVGRLGAGILATWGLPVGLMLAVVQPTAGQASARRANDGAATCTFREEGILDVTLGGAGPHDVANVGASSGNRTVLGVFDGKECLSAMISGRVTLPVSLEDVSDLSAGGSLSLFDPRDAAGPRADVTEWNGTISRRYRTGGRERPWSEGKQWFSEALARVIRDTGFDATGRVEKQMTRGGVTAVLEEVQRSRSDPGKRKLLAVLIGRGRFRDAERQKLIEAIGTVHSPSDRKTLLNDLGGR
jgi:beta-lactamase regulating signal transducer with metallopeptidase domain